MAHNPQETRIAALEDRLAATADALGGELRSLEERLRRLEPAVAAPALVTARHASGEIAVARSTHDGGPSFEEHHRGVPLTASTGALRGARDARRGGECDTATRRSERAAIQVSWSDLIGGRILAWVGGAAVALGIAMFLALAISHGWIGEEARTLLAGAVSLALLGGGIWLHDRRGRTEAAAAVVGTAVAGLFTTLTVAGSVYELIPGVLALAGAMAVGAVATVLAIRWAGRPIAGLGLIGALAAPALVGAPADGVTLAMLLATAVCAMWVAARQRWAWVTLATVAVCAPEWAIPMLEGQPVASDLFVLGAFAGLGLAGAVALARDGEATRTAPTALATLTLSALFTGLFGRYALGTGTTGSLWLAALAAAHLLIGAVSPRRLALGANLRSVLVGLGVAIGDVAFALSFHGLALAIGWGASGVLLAAAGRRTGLGERTETAREIGIGVQISLALVRALIDAPPENLMSGHPQLTGMVSLAAVAAGCMACAHLTGRSRGAHTAFAGGGLAAIAYLTASTLDGPALVAAWAAEALALATLEHRTQVIAAGVGGLVFAGAAVAYTLIAVAPPTGLTGGDADLGGAAIALVSLAAMCWRAGLVQTPAGTRRQLASIASGAMLLYLTSLAVATLPQGQVALSALWGAAGVAALIVGLRHNAALLRNVALGMLLATVGKVFLYDLSTLASIARVISFLVLGLLLLAGAFAYQRLRPAPQPDMRAVHPSQR
jgi:uncharacterized membrane protein